MADEKITDYTAVTSFAGTDLLEIVVDPAGTPANRKIAANVIGSGLAIVSGTDANTTMARNSHYVTDISAWATADRDYTLPTTATIGDRIRVSTLTDNATYELIVKTGAGQTCAFRGASIAAATEITRLFIVGETMLFEYVASNKWMCIEDGRVPMQGNLRLSTSAASTEAANTPTYPTDNSGVWTSAVDIGGVTTTSNGRLTARRAGKINVSASGRPSAALADQELYGLLAELNGTTIQIAPSVYGSGASGFPSALIALNEFPVAVNDYLRLQYRSGLGSKGLSGGTVYSCHFAFTEVL